MYRVLVADDEPIERMIVGRTIKKYFSGQLEVVEAVNGREAAKFFTEKDCKIALLDIEMPGVNGLEAAEQIASRVLWHLIGFCGTHIREFSPGALYVPV